MQAAAAPRATDVGGRADPDSDVVEQISRGDTDGALRCLMTRHGAAIYRYCRVELRDAALADDIHQQIFYEAFRDLGGFRERSTLRTWLFSIAHHRVLDALKRRRRAKARIDDGEPPDVPDPRPSALESIDERRLLDALLAALAELPGDVSAAVLLRFQQGFTYDEMAEIFDEKPGTLHARVARAMPQLRGRIEARIGAAPLVRKRSRRAT